MFQINNVAVSLNSLIRGGSELDTIFNIAVGIIIAVLVGAVIIGGIKSIGRFAAKIVPFMSVFYVVGGLTILLLNYTLIPQCFETIFYYAFHTPQALAGVRRSRFRSRASVVCRLTRYPGLLLPDGDLDGATNGPGHGREK